MAVMWHAGEPQDGILWVEINWRERPVNALLRDTLNELSELIGRIRSDSAITGVVFKSGKSGNFIAGADVTEFQKIRSPDEARQFVLQGQHIFDDLASLKVPTVALISGACLGGGLEFALACRWRIADYSRKTQIGLPEVMLGIVPGWGGTLRLPKTVGFAEAVPLLLTGRALNGRQAARKGLVHDAVPTEGLDHVARTLLATGGRHLRPRKVGLVGGLIDRLGPLKKLVLWQATKQVHKTTHGHYPAPFEIIEVLREGISQSPEEHLSRVRDANVRLGQLPVTRELVRLFFLSEGAKKVPESLGASVDADTIEHAAVIGAGAMGAGIALLAARRGVWTRLKDINADFVARGMKNVRKLISTDVKRRRITALEGTQALDHLSPTTDYRGLKQADVIVEAVVEELDIKHQVFTELANATGPQLRTGDEHQLAHRRRDCRRRARPVARGRPALLQSATPDATGRGRPWPAIRSADGRQGRRPGHPHRQNAGAGGGLRGISGQSHSGSLHERSGPPRRGGRRSARDRPGGRRVRHADGAAGAHRPGRAGRLEPRLGKLAGGLRRADGARPDLASAQAVPRGVEGRRA